MHFFSQPFVMVRKGESQLGEVLVFLSTFVMASRGESQLGEVLVF